MSHRGDLDATCAHTPAEAYDADVKKHVARHTFRHSVATRLLKDRAERVTRRAPLKHWRSKAGHPS